MKVEMSEVLIGGKKEFCYSFFPTKNRKKRIEFKAFELDLLQLLYEHRILSLKQLKYYAKEMYGFNPKTLENKLHKWRDNLLVSSEEYGKKTRYYKILKKGIYILEQTERVDSGITLYKGLAAPDQNTDHFFCSRDVVIQTLVKSRKLKKTIHSIIPSSFKYMIEDTLSHIPDWVLVGKHSVINIEVDTGNQSISSILIEKIKNYIKYAKLNPEENHNVVFVVIDNKHDYFSYIGKYAQNRQERVANIKKAVISQKVSKIGNLKFFAVTSSRAPNLLTSLVTGKYSYSNQERSMEINSIIELLKLNKRFNYDVERLNGDDFYTNEIDRTLYADAHLRITDDFNIQENVLIKFMEEGSPIHMDGVFYLNQLKKDDFYKLRVNRILAFYSRDDELAFDSLGEGLEHVIFGSKEHLAYNTENILKFTKLLGPKKKIEVELL
jgi:Replication-relaxation